MGGGQVVPERAKSRVWSMPAIGDRQSVPTAGRGHRRPATAPTRGSRAWGRRRPVVADRCVTSRLADAKAGRGGGSTSAASEAWYGLARRRASGRHRNGRAGPEATECGKDGEQDAHSRLIFRGFLGFSASMICWLSWASSLVSARNSLRAAMPSVTRCWSALRT